VEIEGKGRLETSPPFLSPRRARMNGGGEQLDMPTFANLIRYWVHYDSMLSGLNKQLKNVRELRNKYESQVLTLLQQSKTENPIIQIAGGRVTVAEEKHQQPLSLVTLKTILQRYYRTKPGTRDESAEIMEFIRTQRLVQVSKCLKRKATVVPEAGGGGGLPPLPPNSV